VISREKLEEEYGKIEGYRDVKGGGYYNVK